MSINHELSIYVGDRVRLLTPWGQVEIVLENVERQIGTSREIRVESDLNDYRLDTSPPDETDPYRLTYVQFNGLEHTFEVSP